jgi:phosphoribosyl 1,2-cyclic phosphodiesterase
VRALILGTGSRGNAILLESAQSRVLVDAGFTRRELARRLRAAGVAPESIEGLIVTHEHADHAQAAALAAVKWGWTVYATDGTVRTMADLAELPVRRVKAGTEIVVGGLSIDIIGIAHDALEPIAVVATDTRTGARVGVVYDLGATSSTLVNSCRLLDGLVLESNHDRRMLAYSSYPPVVQRRIGGRQGHLSNNAAAEFARSIAHAGLRHVVLAHLSEQCNTPTIALQVVGASLRRTRFRGRLTASAQDTLHESSVTACRAKRTVEQLALF